jgi:hypothetical protein
MCRLPASSLSSWLKQHSARDHVQFVQRNLLIPLRRGSSYHLVANRTARGSDVDWSKDASHNLSEYLKCLHLTVVTWGCTRPYLRLEQNATLWCKPATLWYKPTTQYNALPTSFFMNSPHLLSNKRSHRQDGELREAPFKRNVNRVADDNLFKDTR